jgi:hypothetical protein
MAPVGVKVSVDVVGWFQSAAGLPSGEFTPVVPTRLTDQQTIARAQGAVESGSDWLGDTITNNPIHDHLGIDANLCAALCIGLTYQDGNFYLNYGLGAVAGAGIGPSYYSQPLDPESCDNNPNLTAMVGPVSGSISRDMESGGLSTDKGWTVSSGWGLKYSLFLGPMWQKPIT